MHNVEKWSNMLKKIALLSVVFVDIIFKLNTPNTLICELLFIQLQAFDKSGNIIQNIHFCPKSFYNF